MQAHVWIQTTLAAAAFAFLPSCRAGAATEAAATPAPMLLRSYDVAPGTASQVASILNNAMHRDGSQTGSEAKVQAGPNSRSILVLGPAGIQDGVAGLLKSLASEPPPPPPPTITITYWLVNGKRAKDAAIPPELTELSTALKTIQQADGPMAFQTQEKLALISGNDDWAEEESVRRTAVSQSTGLRDGRVVARLKIKPSGSGPNGSGPDRVETTVNLMPGQILVLAQAGAPSGEGSSLYYLVRADVVATSKP